MARKIEYTLYQSFSIPKEKVKDWDLFIELASGDKRFEDCLKPDNRLIVSKAVMAVIERYVNARKKEVMNSDGKVD